MDAITLNIPPGVVDHGTDSRAEGRWHDASFVRWTNGVMHPIGGWDELNVQSIGASEISTDADMENASAWTVSGGTSQYLSGQDAIELSGSPLDAPYLLQDVTASSINNKTIRVEFTIDSVTSTAQSQSEVWIAVLVGGAQLTIRAAGTYSQEVDAGTVTSSNDRIQIQVLSGHTVVVSRFVITETTSTAIPRGAHSWYDNGGIPRIATGTHQNLYAWAGDPATGFVDITPSGFSPGNLNANENLGYGGKDYGEGTYGTARQSDGQTVPATNWILDNYGEDLVALATTDGTIYQWDRSGLATTITASSGTVPSTNKSIIVTAERFLFALGADNDPRKIRWCDREDLTAWNPEPTNEAGDIILQSNGNIVCAEKVRGRTLILTTLDAHVATYQGPPTVYGFQRLASGCGIAGPLLSGAISGMAFWMGESQFFMYNGSTVQPIQCDVHDHIFKNINKQEIGSAFCVVNQQFNEVWWFYPSGTSLENDKYAVYDYLENHWSVGDLARSAGTDSGVFSYPHWFEAGGKVYLHENGFNHGNARAFAESGPMRLNQGNKVVKVNSLIPEEEAQDNVDITFKTRFYPNGAESTHGPYTPANPTDVRFTGRQLRLRVDGDVGADWRFGPLRMRGREGGYR